MFGNLPAQESAAEQFEKALYYEDVQGDLQRAIELYEQILKQFPGNREIAAKAQLHIGLCFEKLGKTEAIKAYEQVLANFADQTGEVAAARERLAALQAKETPAQFSTKILEGGLAAATSALSPDGTKLAMYDVTKGLNAAVYDLATKRLNLITNYGWEGPFTGAYIWSPDSQKVCFAQHMGSRVGNSQAELVTSNLEGKLQVLFRVEKRQSGLPMPTDWFDDGSAIVVALVDPNWTGTLGLVPATGGSFEALHTLKGSINLRFIADASPDGRYIVFEDSGEDGKHDIYIISRDKKLHVLTDHPDDDISPRWSPDGKHVVFKSLRQGAWALWGIAVKDGKPAGEPFPIKEGLLELLNWTKHGLVYKEGLRLKDIFTVSIDPNSLKINNKPNQLKYTPTGNNVIPAWSPDGKRLAFASRPLSSGKKIVVVSADGREKLEFPNPDRDQQSGALHDLRWLPDGSGLSLSGLDEEGKTTLFQLDLKTGEWKKWPIPVTSWTRTEWSNDGKSFLYARHGFDHDEQGIIERNLQSGEERYVYRPEHGRGRIFKWMRLSRDHEKLVMSEDNARIILIDLKTGERQEVTTDFNSPIAISPDAEYILTTGNLDKPNGPRAIYVVSVKDGSAKKLKMDFPKGTSLSTPDWSPNGKQISFVAIRPGKNELFLMKNVIPKNK
jgi:Tol biopolymer transport system component